MLFMEKSTNTVSNTYDFNQFFNKGLEEKSNEELVNMFLSSKDKKDYKTMLEVVAETITRLALRNATPNSAIFGFEGTLYDFKEDFYSDFVDCIDLFLKHENRIEKYFDIDDIIDIEYLWDFYTPETIINKVLDETDRELFLQAFSNFLTNNFNLAIDEINLFDDIKQ